MADEEGAPPPRLMAFVSEHQLADARRARGARVDDGTAQRDRSLYEILKENKDKKDAEFNERFKHRPPKALDEDELEFLEKIETSKREYERQMAEDEEEQLRSFKAALASHSSIVHEIKEVPSPIPKNQEKESVVKGQSRERRRPLGMIVKAKPQAKKAKVVGEEETPVSKLETANDVLTGLISYCSDESDDDN